MNCKGPIKDLNITRSFKEHAVPKGDVIPECFLKLMIDKQLTGTPSQMWQDYIDKTCHRMSEAGCIVVSEILICRARSLTNNNTIIFARMVGQQGIQETRRRTAYKKESLV